MKKEDLFEILGDIDEAQVKEARLGKNRNQRPVWVKWVPWAAVLFIAAVGALGVSTLTRMDDSEPEQNNSTEAAIGHPDIAIEDSPAYDDILIYYVEGNQIACDSEFLPCNGTEVFQVWKEKNGIGEEVSLIEVKIDSNATTREEVIGGVPVIIHTMGDYFIFNITISRNIENYYDTIAPELLLESLKQTMTGYTDIEYDEYHLFLE